MPLTLFCRSRRRVSPTPAVLGLGKEERDGRVEILVEEHHSVCCLVTRCRLEVTEFVSRARVAHAYTLELQAAGRVLRLISLELVRREAVCAAECIQRLEAEERLSLLEAQHCLRGSLQALHACHLVYLGLRRLPREEAAARVAIESDACTLGREVLHSVESLLRLSLMTAEAREWDIRCGSLGLQHEERQLRHRIEVEAAAEQPNVDMWLLTTAAHRERLWLAAGQRLQRSEIVARQRLVALRVAMIQRARQQCVRPFTQHRLALLQRREVKARRLLMVWETLPRALVAAHHTLCLAVQRRRHSVAEAERRARQWLVVTHVCVVEMLQERQKVISQQLTEWGKLLRSAAPAVALCWTSALQRVEPQQRATIVKEWFVELQWLELLTIRIAQEEMVQRAAVGRAYAAQARLFVVQRRELDHRHAVGRHAAEAWEGLAGRLRPLLGALTALEAGRCRLRHEAAVDWARLLQQQCREEEVLRRRERQSHSLDSLAALPPRCSLGAAEIDARRLLAAEETLAFGFLRTWWGITSGLEMQLHAARNKVAELEQQERSETYTSARISQRMAKVSTNLRLAQESRVRESPTQRRAQQRRGAFLTVPSMDDMFLMLKSPSGLSASPSRTPRLQRGSPSHRGPPPAVPRQSAVTPVTPRE
eukprot:EG_transcript_2267